MIDLSNADSGATRLANIVDEEDSVAAISVKSVHKYILGIHLRYFREKEFHQWVSRSTSPFIGKCFAEKGTIKHPPLSV